MKAAFILSLAGSAVAAPSFGSFLDAMFGGSENSNAPNPSDFPGMAPIGTGSGVPYPFPSATDAPFPTGSSVAFPFPDAESNRHVKPAAKKLHIDYQLAPTAAPAMKKRNLKYRKLSASSALASFSLLDPNNTPTATETATEEFSTSVPTELPTPPEETELPSEPTDYPTPPADGPTAPFPTGAAFPTEPAGTGVPSLPTTLETITRGPRPTSAPDAPGEEYEEKPNRSPWMEWIGNLMNGGWGRD